MMVEVEAWAEEGFWGAGNVLVLNVLLLNLGPAYKNVFTL